MYNANHLVTPNLTGYVIRNQKNELNYKKFYSDLDFSLDLIKLREVYERVFRRINFSFEHNGYAYTQHVISVTFKFSNKEYNKVAKDTFVRQGYMYRDVDMVNCACVRDGVLLAIRTDERVSNPLPQDVLGKCFYYDGGCYRAKSNIKTTHTVAELRADLYANGFYCDGIKYVRYKRSPGSGRVGKCLFINEALFKRMWKWGLCGLTVKPGGKIDLAGFESYVSLPLSSLVDTIEIRPENILVIDDYTSCFKETCAAVRLKRKHLTASIEEVEMQNSIWDGQSLLDKSMFPCKRAGSKEQYGMQLLRNLFFKSCCLNTDIQQFFRDHGITSVSQLNGQTRAESLEDIKLITTPSSVKYLKFGSLDQWLDNIEPTFGVVKYEHETPFFNGRLVQAHYQLLNSLQMTYDEVAEFMRPSLEYLDKLKDDPCILRHHIGYPESYDDLYGDQPASTRTDVVYKLLGVNERFAKTMVYERFKGDVTMAFSKSLRCGHVLVNGNYSTMFGNPLEMLYASIGAFNGESMMGVGVVHSTRFFTGAELLGSRSPHVAAGNVWLTRNARHPEITKYFNITPELVCVNSIGENLLERLSGADFDSDTVLLTDNPILIKAARRNYDRFPVPTKLVESVKIKGRYTPEGLAELDIKTAVNKIGEIVNLSQELNSIMWDKLNKTGDFESVLPIYLDVAILDVMSNIEIDSAKREYPLDRAEELQRIKAKYENKAKDGRAIKPNFFAAIAKRKGYYDPKHKQYAFHDTTMDYLQGVMNKWRKVPAPRTALPMASILKREFNNKLKVNKGQIARVIDLVTMSRKESQAIWMDTSGMDGATKHMLVQEIRQNCIDYIAKLKFNPYTAYALLDLLDNEKYSKLSGPIFSVLFGSPNQSFYDVLRESKEPRHILVESPIGEIELYGIRFTKDIIEPDV